MNEELTMKKRHTQRKSRVTKRFVKRSGRRVASAALAAATFSTVAVAGAMTTVEISSYCDQKAGLPIEANILYSTYTEFDPDQCSNYAVACGIDCCNECIDGAGGVCVHIHGK